MSPLLLALVLAAAAAERPESPPAAKDRRAVADGFARGYESFWRRIATAEPYATMGAREVFAYALALCESQRHSERLERLFELGLRMQDRDPNSEGYGNLWWTWRDGRVTDANAVEFCSQDALLIWLRHADRTPAAARQRLREWIELAVEGCLRHRVPTDYTNIAILNAANLVVLGETLGRDDAAAEGYRRLEAILLWTWQFGTHEFCSPTYYAPDLNGLLFLRALAKQDRGRQQADALWQLLWSDLALNWFPPAGRLGGPHSRSYDYLRGLGATDGHLALAGWLKEDKLQDFELLHSAMIAGPPPEGLWAQSQRFPRVVRQRWGTAPAEFRTHALYADVTLGTCGAIYAPAKQDVPLSVDLPGDRRLARCYFMPDGREDPYGQRRYEQGSARHAKALHLTPFWAAAQRGPDALALVVYRPEDLKAPEVFNVQSHFVLRKGCDGLWIGGQETRPPKGVPDDPGRVHVGVDRPVVLRYGTAGVGVRVLWGRRQDGVPPAVCLADDGYAFGALRLTVEHRSPQPTAEAAAALWVRVGPGLGDDAAFHRWRQAFEQTEPVVTAAENDRIALEVPGVEGPVRVAASRPFGAGGRVQLEPRPNASVLELDGREIGRPLLEAVEPIRSRREGLSVQRPAEVGASGVYVEAEDGLVLPGMRTADDSTAAGGRYVWQPPPPATNRTNGTLLLPLRSATSGDCFVWARVQAPDAEHDSLFVRLTGDGGETPRTAWHIRRNADWQWQRIVLEGRQPPGALTLPAGDCLLHLQTREPGVKLDRLFFTRDPEQQPE